MGTQTVTVELPEEIVALLGPAETAPAKAREMLVLELLRRAQIGQGKAAELLGVSRRGLLDLMAALEIPSGPRTVEEARHEIENARQYFEEHRPNAGRQ